MSVCTFVRVCVYFMSAYLCVRACEFVSPKRRLKERGRSITRVREPCPLPRAVIRGRKRPSPYVRARPNQTCLGGFVLPLESKR